MADMINNNNPYDSVVVGVEGDDDTSWRAAVSYSLAGLCLTVFVATVILILVVATTRKFTYNLYIVFLLLPDALLNLVLGIRCIYDGMRDSGHNPNHSNVVPMPLCVAQQIGISLYVSNLFLNAIVAWELYALVWNSYHRRRTKPPTSRTILGQVALVYGITAIFSVWQVLPVDWAEKNVENDPYCTATSRIPAWLSAVVYSLLIGPPVTVVLYVYDKMTRGRLLPQSGRTRVLTMYFMRIFGLFLVFYTPVTIVISYYVTFDADQRNSDTYFWLLEAFTVLNPIQSTISLVVFWQKDDIQQTFYRYTRTSFSLFFTDRGSSTTAAADAENNNNNSNNNHNNNTQGFPKSAWRQHDTYERNDGGVSVVKYSVDENSEEEDDDQMPMWMAMGTTEHVVSATENTETITESPIDLAEKQVVSLPRARPAQAPWTKEAFRRIFPMLSRGGSQGNNDRESDDDDEENAVASSWF